MGNHKKKTKFPMVSVCTPTFNRRPFITTMIKCFENQTYPRNRMEWIIIDDGTDKIEDIVSHIPYIKYFKYDEKMTLGKKRNLLNKKATGDIIVYMDDDDYYPPERVSHAVTSLQNSPALCAGSSAVCIYFKHINKMVQFGPYGPNHATAATFAFKRELLNITSFDETSCVAEETRFLKNYTIPFVQLDTRKSILVFSHTQNSFDKKELLEQGNNQHMHDSALTPNDFVKEPEILRFFMDDINSLLDNYEPGKPEHKPDVNNQLNEIRKNREKMMQEQIQKQKEYQENINKMNSMMTDPKSIQHKMNEQAFEIQSLNVENQELKKKIKYLEEKITQIISEKINEKRVQLSKNEKS